MKFLSSHTLSLSPATIPKIFRKDFLWMVCVYVCAAIWRWFFRYNVYVFPIRILVTHFNLNFTLTYRDYVWCAFCLHADSVPLPFAYPILFFFHFTFLTFVLQSKWLDYLYNMYLYARTKTHTHTAQYTIQKYKYTQFLLTVCIIPWLMQHNSRSSSNKKLSFRFLIRFFFPLQHPHVVHIRNDRTSERVMAYGIDSEELKYFHHDFSNRSLNKLFLVATSNNSSVHAFGVYDVLRMCRSSASCHCHRS